MSIVKLVKITAYGRADEKERALADLQDMGCLHLIPLKLEEERLHKVGPSSESREVLKFLVGCPQRRSQITSKAKFDASAVEREVLDLKKRMEELEDERDFLRARIRDLRPWGRFTFSSLEEMKGLRLWFFTVPHHLMNKVEATDLNWEVVAQDSRFDYVVVISENEPDGMPVARTRTGNKSLDELEAQLIETERKLDAFHARRANLTKWILLFTQSIYRLEDRADLVRAAGQTYDDEPIFALQAWAPEEDLGDLRAYAKRKHMILELERPAKEEEPPTLLKNKRSVASGQDLVSFYTTPNYWLWDPSGVVFFSFAIFFAMIISDAAYGMVFGLVVGLLWRKLGKSDVGKRLRIMGVALVAATIIYGVMVGSYFGVAPRPESVLHRLKIIDINNFSMMMKISVIVGVIHLIIANAADALRWRWSSGMFAPLGWIAVWVGAVLIWQGVKAGAFAMGGGAFLILFFTSVRGPLWKRLLMGLKGLARISGAFGDTLSYLRLFALGLASASLAITFNDLAKQVGGAVPGIGFLFSILIIILGHGLNLMLAFASGVIHGLRLNFIEFFNWGMPEEGYPFRAFERKEKVSWTT